MKGLFILYHYPPALKEESPASSIQNLRFVQGLKSNNIDYTVIRKGEQNSSHDPNIISINSISKRIPKAVLRRVMPDLINIPDVERFLWAKKVKKYLNNLNIKKYDWVHTTCSPYSNHLIGLFVKEKYNIPWVAQFYDPWVDNPYREFKYSFFRNLDKKYEVQVAEKSDLIILSNNIVKKKWIERYGHEISKKILILPFCSDPNINPIKQNIRNQKLVLVHAGGIYGKRDLKELVIAVVKLKKEINQIKDKLEIRLIGTVSKSEILRIKENDLFDIFKLYGEKSYSFTQDQLNDADIILVIDSLELNDNVHFPSKLVESFSYQKPIIGITSINSVSNDLLREASHLIIHKEQSDKLMMYLKKAVSNQNFTIDFNKDYYKLFLPKLVTTNYLKRVNILLNDKN